ncbi:sigma-54-dependent Fis family transcriptional regulator [Desulfitobacterium sp. PCE1]|uniref:sigma-54 interaction domain-containing protein n=1 Tax=Desulfitobacterium sp. PCE1 TaxID=146907 RepID=UPI0003707FCF|nr:sigma 54-interacting transcriptional regulator [Desulfitobacterium sp. PCE1]
MVLSLNDDQGVLTTPRVDMDSLKAISLFKDSFVKKDQNTTLAGLLEPEVANSWQRCKKMEIDPYMEKLTYMCRSMELNALLRDKRKFIDLTKIYFNALLPLLNIPTTLTIFDENGTLLDLTDQPRLLRLNPHSGSIWREETVGTSSTSLCLEYGKTVLLAGSRHYCKALEHQLATTSPVCDAQGNKLGAITTINHINDATLDDDTLHRILLWTNTLRYTVESQLELLKRSHSVGSGNTLHHSRFEEDRTLDRSFAGIKGESPQIQTTVRTAARFARTDNGILITGESGTGKEMFAQAVHQASGRRGSFVAINCAALPSNLIASELFGYVGGAFTGAENKGRVGKIELAHEGTLFLDEIGDMPLEIQPTFLRVLEDKKVMRLGSNKDVHVDFRLVAATNCDLFKLVQEKKFRADLYYRLEILQLALPPLRERGQDIVLMANYFLEDNCRKAGRPPFMLSREVEAFILNYPWPGNIRQLKNAMVYAANICEDQVIKMQDLPASLYRNIKVQNPNEPSDKFPQMTSIQETEEEMIRKALTLTGNNVRTAAKLVGLSKTTVYRKIKEYNIEIS